MDNYGDKLLHICYTILGNFDCSLTLAWMETSIRGSAGSF
jgi:hypothetical protein